MKEPPIPDDATPPPPRAASRPGGAAQPPVTGVAEPGQPVAEQPTEKLPRPGDTLVAKPAEGPASDGRGPKLAEGVELLGLYEDSGYKQPPYMARRADGQMVQLPPLLYAVAEEAERGGSYEEVAGRVSERIKRGLSADDLRHVANKQLRPLGILAAEDGSSPKVRKIDPLLALKFRTAVIPERVSRAVATAFKPLFFPPLILLFVGGLIAFDVWLFSVHGVAQGLRHVIYQPALMIAVLGMITVSAAFHEIGHAAACRYGGGNPGVMGAGIYIIWPAFYTDVTDAYRLSKGGRLRTDLGGIYFNAIAALALGGLFFATGFEPLLFVALLVQVEMIRQLQPFLRLDGYYVVSDLTGVPDLFARIRPILASLVPWRKPDESVTALKPWVRVVVSAWVLALIPLALFQITVLVIAAPRIFATGWDSATGHAADVSRSFSGGEPLSAITSMVQLAMLVLPALAISLLFFRMGRKAAVGAWRITDGRPVARFLLVGGLVAALVAAAFLWSARDAYRPIQPDERWTVQDAVTAVAEIPSGEPGLALDDEAVTDDPTEEEPETAEDVEATPSATVSPTPSAEVTPTPTPSVTSTPTPTPESTETAP